MYYNYETELYHYGVKGMKWGVRRAQNTAVGEKKAAYKQAKKDYNKAYNKAYNYSALHPIGQFTNKKKSAEADRRWEDAIDKAKKLDVAKKQYKQAKQDNKKQINKGLKTVERMLTSASKPNRFETHAERSRRESEERRKNMGRVPTIKEQVEKANKLGRVPTRKEELDRMSRYNI